MQGMNYRICGSVLASSALYQNTFVLPVVKHPQQASRGSGMENHQGRLDPDSRPGAEEFRASSSWRLASCASSLTVRLHHTVRRLAIPWLPMLPQSKGPPTP